MRRSLREQPGSATRFAPPNQAAAPAVAAVEPSARRLPAQVSAALGAASRV
jgi:hypothetical protein